MFLLASRSSRSTTSVLQTDSNGRFAPRDTQDSESCALGGGDGEQQQQQRAFSDDGTNRTRATERRFVALTCTVRASPDVWRG